MATAREEAGILLGEDQIPPDYNDFKEVFSKSKAQAVPEHGVQDLTFYLGEGKEHLWGPINNQSAKELETLCQYLEEDLVHG